MAKQAEYLGDAKLSDCGEYRYWLSRTWDPRRPVLVVVMLNPSTADALLDDPTIRRVVGFAERERYGGIIVLNLYALRATKPEALWVHGDPIGAGNDRWIGNIVHGQCATNGHAHVLCAWGGNAPRPRAQAVINLLRAIPSTTLYHLGLNGDGSPKHPLYLRSDAKFTPWLESWAERGAL